MKRTAAPCISLSISFNRFVTFLCFLNSLKKIKGSNIFKYKIFLRCFLSSFKRKKVAPWKPINISRIIHTYSVLYFIHYIKKVIALQ